EGITELMGTFQGCVSLPSVELPKSLEVIDMAAFAYCDNLADIEFHEGITTIGYEAFFGCQMLTEVIIPDSVTTLGEGAFSSTGLRSLTLNDKLTSIPRSAFSYTDLTSVVIPEGVTILEYGAFANSYDLVSISLPSTLAKIEGFVFNECKSLAHIYFNGDEVMWKVVVIDNYCNQYLNNAVVHYAGETEAIIASGNLGDNLTWELADEGKLTLKGSGAMADLPTAADNPWVTYNEFITEAAIADGITSIGSNILAECVNLTTVSIPSSVTSIGDFAFRNTGLTSIEISAAITSIGDRAFTLCEGLETITVDPANLYYTTDAQGVLYNKDMTNLILCPAAAELTEYVVPNTVTVIEQLAFADCTALTTITIPAGITDIETGAFNDCYGLQTVYFVGNQLQWEAITLGTGNVYPQNADKVYMGGTLDQLIVGSGSCGEAVTWELRGDGTLTIAGTGDMDNYLSAYDVPWADERDRVRTVIVKDGVTSIGDYALSSLLNLKTLSIADSVSHIGADAFCWDSALESVQLPGNLKSIGSRAFYWCKALTRVDFSEGITVLPERIFDQCY
ncbi:MAG: leucine-rich repeat domain-containing protein, partial [Clostridia bacterium]|nr:leucine-rich repeat domain-containing protein [Clostridia bacterium]